MHGSGAFKYLTIRPVNLRYISSVPLAMSVRGYYTTATLYWLIQKQRTHINIRAQMFTDL